MRREPPAQAPRVLVNPGAMTPPCGRNCGLRVDLPCGREAGFVFNSANPSPPPPGLLETLPPAGSSHGLKEALAPGSQHISTTSPALTAGGRLSPSPSTPPCHSLHPLSFTFRSAGRLRASVPCSLCQECSLQSYPRPHLLITQVSAPSPPPSPPPRDHVHHQHLHLRGPQPVCLCSSPSSCRAGFLIQSHSFICLFKLSTVRTQKLPEKPVEQQILY